MLNCSLILSSLILFCSILPAAQAWSDFASGVTMRTSGDGCRFLLAFGGFNWLQGDTQIWADNVAASGNLNQFGINSAFATKGPKSSSYNDREIQTSHIVNHLKSLGNRCTHQKSFGIIIAHSSGAFVANDFVAQLHNGGVPNWSKRLVYFNLDGGGNFLNGAAVDNLARLYPSSASHGGLRAPNYSAMTSMASGYKARFLDLDGASSGCAATWCMHMVLVNQHPYNPNNWDMRDIRYVNAQHPCQHSYLDLTHTDLVNIAKG